MASELFSLITERGDLLAELRRRELAAMTAAEIDERIFAIDEAILAQAKPREPKP